LLNVRRPDLLVIPMKAMVPLVIYRPFNGVDRAPLFSANQLVPSYSERGHCAVITRSAPGNTCPVPDPKRTAKPTNGIGKGSAKSLG
jgi:hypothetical protein